MPDLDPAPSWTRRFGAVGKAQNQYLLTLGTAGLFFFALDLALPASPTTEVPGVGLELSSLFVWATGPAVLGFLLAASLGALDATTYASARLELDKGEFEREDIGPNALDMAFYTTVDSSKAALALAYLSYPAYLLVFLLEGAWLWWKLLAADRSEAPLEVALWVGAAMLLLGAMRMPRFVWGKLKGSWNSLVGKRPVPSMREAVELLAESETVLRGRGRRAFTRSEGNRWRFVVDDQLAADEATLPELASAVVTWVGRALREETV